MDILLVANDMICEVSGLKNAVDGADIDSATVNVTISDLDGNNVGGVTWPIVAPNVGTGLYRATLPDTMSLTHNRRYRVTINADAGPGLAGNWRRSAKALNREV